MLPFPVALTVWHMPGVLSGARWAMLHNTTPQLKDSIDDHAQRLLHARSIQSAPNEGQKTVLLLAAERAINAPHTQFESPPPISDHGGAADETVPDGNRCRGHVLSSRHELMVISPT